MDDKNSESMSMMTVHVMVAMRDFRARTHRCTHTHPHIHSLKHIHHCHLYEVKGCGGFTAIQHAAKTYTSNPLGLPWLHVQVAHHHWLCRSVSVSGDGGAVGFFFSPGCGMGVASLTRMWNEDCLSYQDVE